MSDGAGIHVGAATDFDDGDRRLVEVDGTAVGVVRADGAFYAVENVCCHDGGPVGTGTVRARLEATYDGPGERVREDYLGEPTITCPWHGWEYDLATGVHVGDDSIALRTFDVVVEDGEVYVSADD